MVTLTDLVDRWAKARDGSSGGSVFTTIDLEELYPGVTRCDLTRALDEFRALRDVVAAKAIPAHLLLVLPLRMTTRLMRTHVPIERWSWRSSPLAGPPDLFLSSEPLLTQWFDEEYRRSVALPSGSEPGLTAVYRAYREGALLEECDRGTLLEGCEYTRDFAITCSFPASDPSTPFEVTW